MFTEKKPGAPRVALVGCSASKLQHSAPARELYTSATTKLECVTTYSDFTRLR